MIYRETIQFKRQDLPAVTAYPNVLYAPQHAFGNFACDLNAN